MVKRYVVEEGAEQVREAMDRASAWLAARIAYVEVLRTMLGAGDSRMATRFRDEWAEFDVLELDASLAEQAAQLAAAEGLRSLDAVHLASALVLPSADLAFATWDRRLHAAAGRRGLETIPAAL